MIPVVIASQNCWVVTAAPNTDESVDLTVGVPLNTTRRLTGRTSRRPEGNALRCGLEWSAKMLAPAFDALRNATQAAQDEPICVPLWPHAIRVGIDTPTLTSGLTIAWTRGWATYAVNPGSLAGYDFAAPLLFGFLAQLPRLAGRNGEMVLAQFSFEEDGPAEYAIAASVAHVANNFATASAYSAPVFPWIPEGTTPPTPGVATVASEREARGPGRIRARTFYPQSPEQTQSANFRFKSPAAAAQLISWWQQRAGGAAAHWVAGSQLVGRLATSVAIADDELAFTAPIALGTNAYLALFDPAQRIEFARVTATAAQSVTLDAGVAQAWPAASTSVTTAMLARHTGDLVLSYRRANESWIADTELAWREVSAEYTAPAGETRGETLGRLPAPAWFFQIDLDYNGAVRTWYLTNWESGAYANLTNWVYNACTFDRAISSIDLEDDSFNATFRWIDGGPWENWQPGNLSATGKMTIYRADVSAGGVFSNFRLVARGKMKTPTIDGATVKQKLAGANALFARMCPSQLTNRTCGTSLFRPRCGLQLADWIFAAEITAAAGTAVTIGTIARVNTDPLPDGFGAQDWFGLGWIQWLVGGVPYRRTVLASSALAGGEITLTLDRALPIGPGSAVVVAPGCDLNAATCENKFDNEENFRGFRNAPSVSPSFILPQRQTSGGKKG